MAVKIGSARSDENGGAKGGKAGDQKGGREVSTQSWYKYKKNGKILPWRVLRAVDPEAREKLAQAMEWACDTNLIGYDQSDRETLRKAVQPLGWDIRKLTKAVETDCSALVRVCCGWAFQRDLGTGVSYFNTTTMCAELLKTGLFTEMTGDQYSGSEDYLLRGDILVTKSQGHTVIVLSNGSKAGQTPPHRVLKNGMEGEDVKELQTNLILLGYDCGRWGADGDFGDSTEMAVRSFQMAHGLKTDGEYGKNSREAMEAALAKIAKPVEKPNVVEIYGGNCYIRAEANTSGAILGVAHCDMRYDFGGQVAENGWICIKYYDRLAWVSPKYSRLVEA